MQLYARHCEACVAQTMLDNAVVMAMEELLVASLAGAEVEFRRVIRETEGVGLDGMVLGDGPRLYIHIYRRMYFTVYT